MRGELVISSLLSMTGIAFVLLGILMWRKDKIELLHFWKYGWIISVIGFIMFLIRMSHIQNRFNKPKRNKP